MFGKYYCFIAFLFVIAMPLDASPNEKPFVEAAVCDNHVYTHAAVQSNLGGKPTLIHYYLSHYPIAADFTFNLLFLELAVVIGTTGFFGYKYGARGATTTLSAAAAIWLAGAYLVDIPGEVLGEKAETYVALPADCRFVRSEFDPERSQDVMKYLDHAASNPMFNIFNNNCMDFAQRLFDSAGLQINVLHEAAKIRPFAWSGGVSSIWLDLMHRIL